MILEIFLLGLLVFILGPVLYVSLSHYDLASPLTSLLQLMYNIILLCLGRHPLQNPHYIKPDIDKLAKSVVDQIPLVLYIPPPPGESADPITVPPAAHSYPPTNPPSSSSVPKRRFAFFQRKKSKASASKGESSDPKAQADKEKDVEAAIDADDDEDVPWDEMWEKGDYPFVRLEGNRAVCAICLMDFEEPRRIRGKKAAAAADATNGEASSASAGAPGAEATQEIQVEAVTEEERDNLKLTDAGEGAQPLRLLMCGHVFHVSCLHPNCLGGSSPSMCFTENLPGSVAHGRIGTLSDLPATGGDPPAYEEGQATSGYIVRLASSSAVFYSSAHLLYRTGRSNACTSVSTICACMTSRLCSCLCGFPPPPAKLS